MVAADPEVADDDAATGARSPAAGFHPIPEIQPSRHRMALPLPREGGRGRGHGRHREGDPPADPRAPSATASRRALGRRHGRAAARVRPATRRATPPSTGSTACCARRATGAGSRSAARRGVRELVDAGARRRPPRLPRGARGRRGRRRARRPRAVPPRRRLSTVHSGDRAERRHDHPGVMHLLRWRAIQLALAEGRTEMDLGGVDVAGARRVPTTGEPTYGLYEHKRSFGAEWVELAGAHERVARPWRTRLGARRSAPAARPWRGADRADDRRPTIAELVAAAEPAEPRPLGGLLDAPRRRGPASAARAGTTGRSARRRSATIDGPRASPTTRARVRPGTLFVAVPATTSTGTSTSRRPRPPAPPPRSSSARSPSVDVPQLVVAALAAGARARGGAGGTATRRDARRRRGHRDGRQDDDLVPRASPRSRPPGCHGAHRDGRDEGRRAARAPRGARHDARRARAPGDARGDGRRRATRPRSSRRRRTASRWTASSGSRTTPRSSRTSPTSTSTSTGRSRPTARPSCACSSALAEGPANPRRPSPAARGRKVGDRQPRRPGRALVRGRGPRGRAPGR